MAIEFAFTIMGLAYVLWLVVDPLEARRNRRKLQEQYPELYRHLYSHDRGQ